MPFPLVFKALTLASVALLATACATAPPAPVEPEAPAFSACKDPRPQVCTMIYAPVCATHADGHLETHASACNACADDTALTYVNGACEEEPSAS
jgi:hypothetical protein